MLFAHPRDRRFGKSRAFIFFCAGHIGKNAIHGVIHPVQEIYHTDSSSGRRYICQAILPYAIPHVIRTSHAYKKTRFLDLLCMFRRFGAPEMFEVVQSQEPWSDPVRFANHFRHMLGLSVAREELFVVDLAIKSMGYVNSSGSWNCKLVGSPYVYVPLWTGMDTEQLMIEHVTTTTRSRAGGLRDLVVRHQIHRCTTYCKATPGSRY